VVLRSKSPRSPPISLLEILVYTRLPHTTV
jgi:hypothetical protein